MAEDILELARKRRLEKQQASQQRTTSGVVSEAGETVPIGKPNAEADILDLAKQRRLEKQQLIQQSQQPQEEQGFFESAYDAFQELVTGEKRREALPKEVRNLPEIAETDEIYNLKLMTGLMLETDAEGRKNIIESAIPDAKVRMVNDTQIVTFPDGKEMIVDRPGFSPQDLSTLSAQTLMYLTPARFTSMITKLIPRTLATGTAEGGVNYLIQKGSEALGSKQGVDPVEVGTAAVMGGGAEVGASVIGYGARKAKEVFDQTALMKKVREGRIDSDTSDYVLSTFKDKDPYPAKIEGVGSDVVSEAGEPVRPFSLDEQVPQATEQMPTSELPFIPEAPKGLKEKTAEAAKQIPFSGERVIKHPLADEMNRQKIPPLLKTNLRETNTATRNAAKDVMQAHSQEMKTGVGGIKDGAYDLIGKQFTPRVKVVLDATKDAIKKQDKAIQDLAKYKGADLDAPLNDIGFDITESLTKYDIGVDRKTGQLDFKQLTEGSSIRGSGEKELQKHWNDLRNAKTAADLHKIKKNIQTKLKDSYNKTGNTDFDSDTVQILDGWQKSINNQLRNISPNYKQANETLSRNISAIKKLEQAVPSVKKYDLSILNDESPNLTQNELETLRNELDSSLGLAFRKLDTNYEKSIQIEGVIDTFDDLAIQYGYKPEVNIKALSRILNSYKSRVGDRSGTFGSQIESAIDRSNMKMLPDGKPVDKLVNTGRGVINELDNVRGVSNENAEKVIFEYIDDLNKRAK